MKNKIGYDNENIVDEKQDVINFKEKKECNCRKSFSDGTAFFFENSLQISGNF